jgi:putative ABC transport system permease protein
MGLLRFFRRARWDAERARELQAYVEHEIDDNLARGMTPDAARRAAHRKLGNPTLIREEIYDMNTLRFVESGLQDVRYGLRLLRKNPTFAIVAILTLALGTGANAAIFQLVNAVHLRTLPVDKPEELVSIGIDRHGKGRIGLAYGPRAIHTESIWRELQARQQAFSGLAAWANYTFDIGTTGEFTPVPGLIVSGGYFETLGVRAQLGRLLTPADDTPGCGAPGVVLSHGFWQSRFGGSPEVIGQPITLSRRSYVVLGVTPPGFFGVEVGRTFDAAIPLCAEPLVRPSPTPTPRIDRWWLDIAGRLAPGWTIDSAGAHLAAISPGIFDATVAPTYNAEMAANYRANTLTAEPAGTGVSMVRARYASHLWVLLGATALVLLITCANLANLMLARATAREREIAVRLAIGASRGRLVRQLLSESLLIALLGAAGGALLAQWMSRALVQYLSTDGNRIVVDLAPDWRVFLFIALIAVAACVAFGLSPAVTATAAHPNRAMQGAGRSGGEGHEAFTMRRALVVAQVALSLVLIVGAVLFGRSLRNLATLDPGFRTDGLVATSVSVRRSTLGPEGIRPITAALVDRIRQVPGVTHVTETMIPPLAGAEWNGRIVVDGAIRDGMVYFNLAGRDYFSTLDIPLRTGRVFDGQDRLDGPKAAVVNETFVRRYLGGEPALGRTFAMEGGPGQQEPPMHIVGVVADSKYGDLREEPRAVAYLAFAQEARLPPFIDLLVRTNLPTASITPVLTRTITDAAPGALVTYRVTTSVIRDSLVTERVMASLSGFFGVLAILIASIGLYGVMSYTVTRRTIEIGIRMALGAEPRTVVAMVLRESGLLLLAGVLIGLGLAALATRSASTLLYGLQPWDPASFAIAAAALALVSLLAAWLPARRASWVAPTVALRD